MQALQFGVVLGGSTDVTAAATVTSNGSGTDGATTAIPDITTRASTLTPECPHWQRCAADPDCHECISTILPFAQVDAPSQSHTPLANQKRFFSALAATASCKVSDASSPSVMLPLFGEISIIPACGRVAGADGGVNPCQAYEYVCSWEPQCRTCLTALYGAVKGDHVTAVLNTSACRNAGPTLQSVMELCAQIGGCSFAKMRCENSSTCAKCLESLRDGDGAKAALLCGTGVVATLVVNVVNSCTNGAEVVCAFSQQRCTNYPDCRECRTAIDNFQSVSSIVRGATSAACQSSRGQILELAESCSPTPIPECEVAATTCAVTSPSSICSRCLQGTATPAERPQCAVVLSSISGFCASCPSSVHTVNAIVLATSIVGGVSVVVCLMVVVAIIAHGHDRVSMRDRIIVGMMIANAVYSSANAIPLNRLGTHGANCGYLALGFDAIRFGRAWYFGGKYMLVCFELLILGASLWALVRGGQAVRTGFEVVLHSGCVLGGVFAFVGFYVRCAEINQNDGFNTATQIQGETNTFNHINRDDDLDDDAPGVLASAHFR